MADDPIAENLEQVEAVGPTKKTSSINVTVEDAARGIVCIWNAQYSPGATIWVGDHLMYCGQNGTWGAIAKC
jgi:hypothetical protein